MKCHFSVAKSILSKEVENKTDLPVLTKTPVSRSDNRIEMIRSAGHKDGSDADSSKKSAGSQLENGNDQIITCGGTGSRGWVRLKYEKNICDRPKYEIESPKLPDGQRCASVFCRSA